MEQDLITVFEDRKQRVNLSPTQINDLLSFRSILSNHCVRLDYDGSLQIMHYVGFISKGKTRLQVLPKIYEKTRLNSEEEARESMRVLLNLLKISEYNKVLHLPNTQKNSVSQTDLLELFIAIFADQVFRTYSTKMNREYVDIEENSSFVKGKIDFAETTKKIIMRRDRHYICYQSFEHDNVINNVVKTVAIKLLEHTTNSENKKSLKRALMFLDDARKTELSMPLIESAKFSRLNMDFKPVFDMAKMFYLNLQPENYAGDQTVFSFLIPVNDLFEYYLYKLLDGMEGYHAEYQVRRAFARTADDRNILTIKPDILVYKEKHLALVVDAKYKNPCYENGIYNNISPSDIYQVFAYAKAYRIKKISLIYPQFDEQPTESSTIIINDYGSETILKIICIDIKCTDVASVRRKLQEEIESI